MSEERSPEEAHYGIITAIQQQKLYNQQKQKTNDQNYLIPTSRRIASQPMEKQLSYYKNLIQQYEKNIEEKKKLNVALIEDKERLLRDFELEKQQLNEQNNKFEQRCQELESEIRKYAADNHKDNIAFDELKSQLEALWQKNNNLEQKNTQLLNDKMQLEQKENLRIRYCDVVDEAINKIEKENQANVKSLAEKKQEINKMQKIINDYNRQLDDYKRQNANFESKVKAQEQMIYKLKKQMNPNYYRFLHPENHNSYLPSILSKQQNTKVKHLYCFNNPKYKPYQNLSTINKQSNRKRRK